MCMVNKRLRLCAAAQGDFPQPIILIAQIERIFATNAALTEQGTSEDESKKSFWPKRFMGY